MEDRSNISFIKSIGGKLIAVSSLIIISAMVILTVIALLQMSSSINGEAIAKLEAIQAGKQTEILDLFERTGKDSEVISATQEIKDAVEKLILYHEEMNISGTGDFDITGESEDLTRSYTEIYDSINKDLQKYNDVYGYYDVFIICAKHGHVMYTNAREADLGENISVGQYRDSGLGKLYKKVQSEGKTAIVDLEPYAPSDDVPAMFIGSPLFEQGEMKAIIALQVNNGKINKILNSTAGMGESGEAYCVGPDMLMRTESRFSKQGESTVLSLTVDTPASDVLNLEDSSTFHQVFKDYRGIEVVSVFSHTKIDETLNADFDWALIAEIDEAEIMAPVYSLIIILVILAAAIIAIAIVAMIFLSRSISKPIQAAVEASQEISKGNLKIHEKLASFLLN